MSLDEVCRHIEQIKDVIHLCKDGDCDALRALLDTHKNDDEARVSLVNILKGSPIWWASYENKPDILKMVIDSVGVHRLTHIESALKQAIIRQSTACVRLWLEIKPDLVNADDETDVNHKRYSFFEYAIDSCNENIIGAFLQNKNIDTLKPLSKCYNRQKPEEVLSVLGMLELAALARIRSGEIVGTAPDANLVIEISVMSV